MRLDSSSGPESLTVAVVGYQFPDAEDPQQRYSWHDVVGEAKCRQGSWDFAFAALTCDESPLVSTWLTTVADWFDVRDRDMAEDSQPPSPLSFTEPNLAFKVSGASDDGLVINVTLNCEFKPPWYQPGPGRTAGNPFTMSVATTPASLRKAAAEWDEEIGSFPDGLL